MVRLGEMNCGRISEVAGNIGRQLLPPVKGKGTRFFPVSGGGKEVFPPKNPVSDNPPPSPNGEVSQQAIELFNQGVDRYDAGDLEGAIAAYEKALEIDPKYHMAWNGLGNALKDLGRYTEAIAAYEKALEIDPKFDHAWSNLGVSLGYLGRYNEAIAAFEKALEIDPKFDHAWYNLGVSLGYLGRYNEAIAALEKALEIYPKYHHAWNNLGNALHNLGRYNEAIAALEKALEFSGNQKWQAWVTRGWAFIYSGRYIEAIQNWDEGLQEIKAIQNWPEGLRTLRKYLSIPSNRDYRLACGTLHQQKGEAHYKYGKQTTTYFEYFHKAKASYEQAREFLKSPLIPETYLEVMQGLITVCRSLGDPKTSQYITEATTVLETLLLDNETHPEIKLRLQRKFVGLYQLEVDILVESGKKINALEKAEARKNFCLQWMRATSRNRTASPTYPEIRELLENMKQSPHQSPIYSQSATVTV